MLYCFLNSDNKEQKYSTLFEALTKCYTPLGESPLCLRDNEDAAIKQTRDKMCARVEITNEESTFCHY